jgi:hypothetical protein
MEINKNYLEDLKIKAKSNEGQRTIEPWQEYAVEVVKMFGIKNKKVSVVDKKGNLRIYTKNYTSIIFRHAKNNMSYLQGKVEMCKEKFGLNLEDKGNYLISLFRKQKPWEK